ncbi:MAG: tyrosine--tRNA ligase, partial [Pseudomonadales bacterium]
LLQSYDFAVLNQRYGCTIQIGGSDQWGNITAGIDLVRRMGGGQAYGLTYPLVTKADGTKFGKTSGGAIWLDADKTSPYGFYQFWLNTADPDALPFIHKFTFLETQEIAALAKQHEDNPGQRAAHLALAQEMTRLVHGEAGLQAAESITDALFNARLDALSESDLAQLALDGMETSTMNEPSLVDALVTSGLAKTPKGEVTPGQARKLIKSNSVSVNGVKADDTDQVLHKSDALFGKYFVLQKGKKHHHLVLVD